MNLKNDFSQETRELFCWNKECFVCGKNTWSDIHHILGRCSNSPLNASPVCHETCHLNKGFSYEDKKILLKKTLMYLFKNKYKMTKGDKLFFEQNQKYYD